MLDYLNKLHVPSFVISFLLVLAGQISVGGVSVNGQSVDLTSSTGRAAAFILIVGAVLYALQHSQPAVVE